MNTKQLKKAMPRAIAYAEQHGFTLEHGKKHSYFLAPNGRKVYVARTPSDHRADKNTVMYLRRCALGDA